KVLVYLPHIMIGFALVAGTAVSAVTTLAPAQTRSLLALVFVVAYGGAATAYHEKWYARGRKGERLPYEPTEATLPAVVPAGSKYVFASPQFWTPFHADAGVAFYSYAAAHPSESDGVAALDGVADNRPIVLVVDEYQWLPELVGLTSSSAEWQQT